MSNDVRHAYILYLTDTWVSTVMSQAIVMYIIMDKQLLCYNDLLFHVLPSDVRAPKERIVITDVNKINSAQIAVYGESCNCQKRRKHH